MGEIVRQGSSQLMIRSVERSNDREVAKEVLKPNELKVFESALYKDDDLRQIPIRLVDNDELINQSMKVLAETISGKIGLNTDMEIASQNLRDVVMTNYTQFSIREISNAFTMYAMGFLKSYFDDGFGHYGKLTMPFVAEVLRVYNDHRHSVFNKVIRRKELMNHETIEDVEQKIKEANELNRYAILNYYDSFKNGGVFTFPDFGIFIRHLQKAGLIDESIEVRDHHRQKALDLILTSSSIRNSVKVRTQIDEEENGSDLVTIKAEQQAFREAIEAMFMNTTKVELESKLSEI